MKWEYYFDADYSQVFPPYGMYVVKLAGDTSNYVFHAVNRSEAEFLSDFLNCNSLIPIKTPEDVIMKFSDREFTIIKESLYKYSLHTEEAKALYKRIENIGNGE